MSKKPKKHGGFRIGAGRKPKHDEDVHTVAARLPMSHVAALDAKADRLGLNRSEGILEAVRAWVKRKK